MLTSKESLGFGLDFFYYSLSFSQTEKNVYFRKDRRQPSSNTGCDGILLTDMLSLNLEEVSIKTLRKQQSTTHHCGLKGPWCLPSLACYKNNSGYKCLRSTNFISEEASLLSHPNKPTSTHAQIAFLTSVTLKDR